MLPAMPQAITQPTERAASGVPRMLAAKAGAHRAPAKAITTSRRDRDADRAEQHQQEHRQVAVVGDQPLDGVGEDGEQGEYLPVVTSGNAVERTNRDPDGIVRGSRPLQAVVRSGPGRRPDGAEAFR